MTKLSIIILSYNTKDLLRQTLNSIPKNSQWEIIVIDNNSQDGSVEMLQKEFVSVTLIKNKKNRGFAAANNQGIKIAKGEYLLLLNSDTLVQKGAIERLVQYLDQQPAVGAVTPKVVLPDGAIDLACHRGLPTPWRAFTYFTKLEALFPESKLFGGYHLAHLDFNQTHEVEATAATAMMIRSQVVDEVGMLDERFFFYAEDLDWCKRIRDAGWKIVYLPEAEVLHFKSQSGKKKQDATQKKAAQRHFWDTMKQFYEKHYENQYPWLVKQLVFTGIELKKRLSR